MHRERHPHRRVVDELEQQLLAALVVRSARTIARSAALWMAFSDVSASSSSLTRRRLEVRLARERRVERRRDRDRLPRRRGVGGRGGAAAAAGHRQRGRGLARRRRLIRRRSRGTSIPGPWRRADPRTRTWRQRRGTSPTVALASIDSGRCAIAQSTNAAPSALSMHQSANTASTKSSSHTPSALRSAFSAASALSWPAQRWTIRSMNASPDWARRSSNCWRWCRSISVPPAARTRSRGSTRRHRPAPAARSPRRRLPARAAWRSRRARRAP